MSDKRLNINDETLRKAFGPGDEYHSTVDDELDRQKARDHWRDVSRLLGRIDVDHELDQ